MTTILALIELDDDDLTGAYETGTVPDMDDLTRSLDARLDEVYCGPHDSPVRGRLIGPAHEVTRIIGFLGACWDVTVDGADADITEPYGLTEADVDHAWDVTCALNASLQPQHNHPPKTGDPS